MSDTFQPELGQMLFGGYMPGHHAPKWVGEEIRFLCEEIIRAYPDALPVNYADDEWSTGIEQARSDYFTSWGCGWFENETFLVHGYTYDDSCVCGAYVNKARGDKHSPLLTGSPLWKNHHDLILAKLCVCPDGWNDTPRIVEMPGLPPEFVFKPRPFAVSWYKHPDRGVSITEKLDHREFRGMIQECVASLATEPVCATADWQEWPPRVARRAKFQEIAAEFAALDADGQRAMLGLE